MTVEAYDALQQAGELCLGALRAPSDAERYAKASEAIAMLLESRKAQERAILIKWLAADGRCIIVAAEVAPTLDMRAELQQDMAALGWEYYPPAGIYRKLAAIETKAGR